MITGSSFTRIEDLFGHPLPAKYKQFLLQNNGGRCEPCIFDFYENGRQTLGEIDWFLAVNDGGTKIHNDLKEYIYTYKIEQGHRIPKDFLPIAHDSGGNLVCISCDSSEYGSVYFWDHEMEGTGKSTHLIAANLDIFLSKLKTF